MFVPYLMGGLGNILFQLLSVYCFAKEHGHSFGVNPNLRMQAHHSDMDYWSNILIQFRAFFTPTVPTRVITEEAFKEGVRYTSVEYQFYGYWQHWKHLWKHHGEVCRLLSFDTSIKSKYPRLSESAFVHIRGGDYINHPVHGIELKSYYKRALTILQEKGVKHVYILTNDRSFAERYFFLEDMDHTYVDDNEISSLYVMSQCHFGGIAANSTFSWWGLFLNPHRPCLIIPDKWSHDNVVVAEQYAFPGTTILPV